MKAVASFAPLATVKELLDLYRIRALKKLSQNFLLDPRLINKIVQQAGDLKNFEVCEVGPGPGGITRSVMMREPKRVIVIEKDTRFKEILTELQSSSVCKFDAIYADVLDYSMDDLFDKSLTNSWEDKPPDIHLIGNLPFNISTPLIIRWMKDISLRRSAWSYGRVPMTLTFQHEVAQRMVAPPFSKARGRISVMCQNWCRVDYGLTLRGKSFLPKVDVDVGVVKFLPLKNPIIPLEFNLIEKVVKTIFNNRQKFSIAPAKKLFPVAVRDESGEKLFRLADVSQQRRPFELSNDEWNRLCFAYKEICDNDPRLFEYNYRAPLSERIKDYGQEENRKKAGTEELEEEKQIEIEEENDMDVGYTLRRL